MAGLKMQNDFEIYKHHAFHRCDHILVETLVNAGKENWTKKRNTTLLMAMTRKYLKDSA